MSFFAQKCETPHTKYGVLCVTECVTRFFSVLSHFLVLPLFYKGFRCDTTLCGLSHAVCGCVFGVVWTRFEAIRLLLWCQGMGSVFPGGPWSIHIASVARVSAT